MKTDLLLFEIKGTTIGMATPVQVGKYEILERIGGHMCPVYRARDIRLGRPVAMKLLPQDAGSERRERLLAEARVSSGLRHENLVPVLDFGEENGQLYLVMELLAGSTLKEALLEGRLKALEPKLRTARDLASVIAYIHQNGIIHRDIKPDNIFLSSGGKAMLMDFGVAKFEGLQLTDTGYALGTPNYMSPEQVRGEKITPLVDVYSYGICLYEMFAGVRAINAASVPEVFDKIVGEPVDLAPLQATSTPGAVIELIARCARKNPAKRPQSFEDILTMLPQ